MNPFSPEELRVFSQGSFNWAVRCCEENYEVTKTVHMGIIQKKIESPDRGSGTTHSTNMWVLPRIVPLADTYLFVVSAEQGFMQILEHQSGFFSGLLRTVAQTSHEKYRYILNRTKRIV